MSSPFPGMDPFLEDHWGDVHARLIVYACDQIQTKLPNHLRARIEERVFFETLSDEDRSVFPDIRVVESTRAKRTSQSGGSTLAVAEPIVVHLSEPTTETYIEVRDVKTQSRVVSVIEILSPSNKHAGEGQEKYLEKRRELRDGSVSLVEIDLLRKGRRLFPFPPEYLPRSHQTHYNAWVRRGWDPTAVRVYAIPLRERLPIIGVPLRQDDQEVPLELQPLIEQAYRNGGYKDCDYEQDPVPPLNRDDTQWADALMREKGLRRRKSIRPGRSNGKRRKAN